MTYVRGISYHIYIYIYDADYTLSVCANLARLLETLVYSLLQEPLEPIQGLWAMLSYKRKGCHNRFTLLEEGLEVGRLLQI